MITSSSNQSIKAARKLATRKGRHAAARLLVEGVRLLGDAWRSGVRPDLVFYAPELLLSLEGVALREELAAAGCTCLPCTAAVFATLSETASPQGIAGVLPLPTSAWPRCPSLLLILDGISDPGNAGTLIRTAEAAGCDGVIFAPDTVDPFNDKVVRAGMAAHFRLPLRVCSTWPAVAALLAPGMPCYVADIHAPLAYTDVEWGHASAVLVGNEAHGPSAGARALGAPISIPMHGAVESLNAAVAGAVILFEAARQRRRG